MPQPETIVEKTYALVKFMLPILGKYPREQRFLLADRTETLALDLLEKLVEATYSPPAAKRPLLQQVNVMLEKLRFLVRLAYESGFYNSTRYKEISEKIQEIGRMNGGWLKSLDGK